MLWSGRLAVVADPHSDQQLARGFLPYRHQRGISEVRGNLANLWYATTRALGFKVGTIPCPDPLFVRQMSTLCPGAKGLEAHPGRLWRPKHLPDVVFLDLTSFPLGLDSSNYWQTWWAPHLFYCSGANDSGGDLHVPTVQDVAHWCRSSIDYRFPRGCGRRGRKGRGASGVTGAAAVAQLGLRAGATSQVLPDRFGP